jgi:hypothetical protein
MSPQEQPDSLDFAKSLGILTATLKTARAVIEMCFKCGHVPCLIGEAGIGKTAVYSQIAADHDWDALFYYLAHEEPEDIVGIPVPNKGSSTYEFFIEKRIHDIINSKRPVVLIFDEWNRGDKAVMNAAFPAMESRRLGSVDLPDHIYIGAAMNPSEGTYIVNEAEKDPAFRRRMCFIGIRTDKNVWIDWARNRGDIHPTVIDFVNRQDHATLLDTAARDAGKVYACPASWEKISDTIKTGEAMVRDERQKWDDIYPVMRVKMAGHIGDGLTSELLAFHQNSLVLVNPDDVIFAYNARARAQVLELVNQNNHPALARAADAVGTAIATCSADPEDIVENVSDFANDLPHDVSGALFRKISQELKEVGNEERRKRVTRALGKCPAFKKSFLTITSSFERAEEDRAKSKDKDQEV